MVPTLLTFEFPKSCTMSNIKHTTLFGCKNVSKLYSMGSKEGTCTPFVAYWQGVLKWPVDKEKMQKLK